MNPECHQPIRVKLPKGTHNRRKRQQFLRVIINEAIDWDDFRQAMKAALLYGQGFYHVHWKAGDDFLR